MGRFFWLRRRWWSTPDMPRSLRLSLVALGAVGSAAAGLPVVVVVVLLFADVTDSGNGVPLALLLPCCVAVATGCVLAMVRLRAGDRSGWVLGLALLALVAAAVVWDSVTARGGRLPVAAFWPVLGIVALLMPATRAHVRTRRPAL